MYNLIKTIVENGDVKVIKINDKPCNYDLVKCLLFNQAQAFYTGGILKVFEFEKIVGEFRDGTIWKFEVVEA